MPGTPSDQHPSRFRSISRRFSYALIGVVTVTLLGFAALAVFVNVGRIETELETHLEHNLRLAETSLVEPLWNYDYDFTDNFIDALFLDESILYMNIYEGTTTFATRTRPGFEQKDFSYFERSSLFKAGSSDIG
jgi:hypothetical protein